MPQNLVFKQKIENFNKDLIQKVLGDKVTILLHRIYFITFHSVLGIGVVGAIDPFTKRHKLVHNCGFPKFEVLYCSQNVVKFIKIQ